MLVIDIITHLRIYVEDATECGHGTYIYGPYFGALAYEFYSDASSFTLDGSQTYHFYTDFFDQYGFPKLTDSNFNTRNKFETYYSKH